MWGIPGEKIIKRLATTTWARITSVGLVLQPSKIGQMLWKKRMTLPRAPTTICSREMVSRTTSPGFLRASLWIAMERTSECPGAERGLSWWWHQKSSYAIKVEKDSCIFCLLRRQTLSCSTGGSQPREHMHCISYNVPLTILYLFLFTCISWCSTSLWDPGTWEPCLSWSITWLTHACILTRQVSVASDS